MSDRKACVRCSRQIDACARICPFCNWEQSELPPPPKPRPAVKAVAHEPPWHRPWENRALTAAALGALLVIAFVVGSLMHGFAPAMKTPRSPAAPTPVEVNPSPPKNITLVPVTGSEATAPVIEAPITSVPASSTAQEANDTTALPSEQYAAAAARVRAQRQAQQQQPKVTDPRALTGAPYQEAPAPSAPAPPPSAQPVRTTAFPEYKPLPRMTFDRQMTARLTVTVDPDGRVTDIEVNQPVPQMPKIIAAVQNWRFRPATENGMPVTARVAVDIIFHGNG